MNAVCSLHACIFKQPLVAHLAAGGRRVVAPGQRSQGAKCAIANAKRIK